MRQLGGAIAGTLWLLLAVARAEDSPGSAVVMRRATVAGELTITRLGDDASRGPYRIALGTRSVAETTDERPAPGMPIPSILAAFPKLAPYDEVVVLQQGMMGNACNGGPLWFLGLHQSGAFEIGPSIDFCGGADPVIARKGPRLTVTFPGGPPNRGTGQLPTSVWIFEGGKTRQVR